MAGRPETRTLFASDSLAVGVFHCYPDDCLWNVRVSIGASDHVVFPRTPVRIWQEGHRPFLATANHVVFYRSDQEYRRARVAEFGDHCLFIEAAEGLLAEVLAGGVVRSPMSHGPAAGPVHVAQLALERALSSTAPGSDGLAIEELAHRIVRMAVSDTGKLRPGSPLRPRAARARHAMVEAAKDILAEPTNGSLTLTDLASRVHASPHHLAHVFRATTGFTLHGYRLQLRLREAARAVGSRRLADIAAEAGFSSHSHFTRQFIKAFSIPPSRLGGAANSREWMAVAEAALSRAGILGSPGV